jgi:multidrug resistance efflux pump
MRRTVTRRRPSSRAASDRERYRELVKSDAVSNQIVERADADYSKADAAVARSDAALLGAAAARRARRAARRRGRA